MKVVEIFNSIEGEGIRAGYPCTFIRLFGCNLNCSYCDSRYACEEEKESSDKFISYTPSVMSIPEIMEQVDRFNCMRVTVTGGEPLIHPGIDKLIQALVDDGYEVNVETNGTQFPKRYILEPDEFFDYRRNCEVRLIKPSAGKVFFTMDWKCKSSGMEDKMNISLVNELDENDVLKFVVGNVEDMDGALKVIEQMTSKPHIFFSPVFGKIEPADIVQYLREKKLNDCRVQLQMHKFIWDPNQRGV